MAPAVPPPTVDQQHALILIVEDDAVLGSIFARVLGSAGYEASVTATPEAGLEKLLGVRPHAIVLDYRMPRINGLGFLYRLRRTEIDRPIPVVVVTGDVPLDDDVQAQFEELGAHVLLKPFTPAALVDAVRLAIEAP